MTKGIVEMHLEGDGDIFIDTMIATRERSVDDEW